MAPPLQATWVSPRVLNPSYFVLHTRLSRWEGFSVLGRVRQRRGCSILRWRHAQKGKGKKGKPDFIWNARARGIHLTQRKISSIRYGVA
jgi:hypothetical protein